LNFLVTAQTGLPRGPEWAIFSQERVTFLTVHFPHLRNLYCHFLPGDMVGVAGHTNLCCRLKPVQPEAVTGLAGNILIFRMSSVTSSVCHLHPLRIAAVMTLLTGLVRNGRMIYIPVRPL
jgi:hypothetical protein